MNLQHLRHFVALAEERHFGRAAKRLNMAQPPLSQSLVRLETSLGFRLLERTRRSVSLTPAGEAFLEDLRPALSRLDRAVRMAKRTSAGSLAQLRIGFVSSGVIDIVPRVLAEVKRLAPDTEVELRELSTSDQLDQLLDGRLDVGFIHSKVRNDPDVTTCIVARYTQMIALPEGWPLAAKTELQIEDLEGLPFIAPPQAFQTDGQTLLEIECRDRGFELQRRQQIVRTSTAVGLVSAGVGFALVTDAIAEHGYPGVRFRPLAGVPAHLPHELSMAWLAGSPRVEQSRVLRTLADQLAIA